MCVERDLEHRCAFTQRRRGHLCQQRAFHRLHQFAQEAVLDPQDRRDPEMGLFLICARFRCATSCGSRYFFGGRLTGLRRERAGASTRGERVSVTGPSAPTTLVSSTRTPQAPTYRPQFPTEMTTLASRGGGAASPWKNA